ncbi:MAG: hypothetical protein HUU37_00995 [Bdellovibrionales bacterium]|nr:hypothetical protein [Bdellovibrionales bacterium]
MIGALWLFVPIFGWLLNMGHRIVMTHKMQHGQPSWPSWNDYPALFKHGALTFLGMVQYHAPAVIHRDGTLFAEDKVVRRALLTVFGQPSLWARLWKPGLSQEELLQEIPKARGSYYYKPADSWHAMIRFPGDTRTSPFPRLSLSEIASGADLAGAFLLVDTLEPTSPSDFYFTPHSRIPYTNPRIAVHASILDSVLRDRGVVIAPIRVDYTATLVFASLAAAATLWLSPTAATAATLALISSAAVIAFASFGLFGVWLRLVHPLSAVVSIFYVVMPYRAILEYRRRWEVQEKHDLLVQVEEMKGNFLSLMSHDLKTPVARIQGLAEMVLRLGGLSDAQKDAMVQIFQSTESLDKFISRILNLTKVESRDIKLDLRSKDVNQLLEKVAEKLSFQAGQKKIKVELREEPLFPILIDPTLVVQVLTNIIDNAIKYSPAGSVVTVSSREVGDRVEIEVADNGPGMTDRELRHLFTKFYRGGRGLNDETKGTGLGLYLSKYFIELHHGSIQAFSAPGQGTRFLIRLPNVQEQVLRSSHV